LPTVVFAGIIDFNLVVTKRLYRPLNCRTICWYWYVLYCCILHTTDELERCSKGKHNSFLEEVLI